MEKTRKEITFNTEEEKELYSKFKAFCKLRGINETSALRESMFIYLIEKNKKQSDEEHISNIKIEL